MEKRDRTRAPARTSEPCDGMARTQARARSSAFRASLTFGLLVCLAACAAPKPILVDFSEDSRTYTAKDYAQIRDRWTRHGVIVRDVGTVLEVWAVYKSWDFRQSYLESYFDIYGVPRATRTALREQQLVNSRETFEFHVTAQSTDYKWNDLEKRDSPWKVVLVDGTGAELPPTRIEVQKLPELYEESFFPARTDFTKTYRIRFDRGAEGDGGRPFRGSSTGRLALRVIGPLGQIDLLWLSGS